MLLKRNLLEIITIISCSGSVLCIFLNYVTNISPISGFWFLSYISFLFIVSLLLSFKFIQWLLHLNRPIKYDLDRLIANNSYLTFLQSILPKIPKNKEKVELKEYDTNELSVISTVLEKKLVSSWYVPYISQEIGFPFACKQMLDQMIGKTFQICNKIESKDVYVDICAVLVSHLKEYKKAKKKHEKAPESTLESHYKKTHSVSDDKNKKHVSADHCINLLRIILKELVPWELWDTPHSELLVRILAKKLDTFVDTTIADPVWLNDRLLKLLNVPEKKPEKIEKPEQKEFKIESKLADFPTVTQAIHEPKTELQDLVEDMKKDFHVEENIPETDKVLNRSEPVEIKPVLRQRRGRQGKNEVKIYDRIIEGNVKTWETDVDLQCISVGQDLLASLDEMTISKLWDQEESDHSPNIRATSPHPLWFDEEETMDLEIEAPKESKKEVSPKPTDALLKDLQSTVHQAKAKIGDLQVLNLDVPCKLSDDEAAGMMEGLLDKGIAGLKKGLRFTGLSDDTQEKSPLHHREKGHERISPSDLAKAKSRPETVPEGKEVALPFFTPKEENGNSVHPLVKQHRVTSQDSVPSQAKNRFDFSSPIPIVPLSDSPEPEYEEAADLSSSIAKLRSLLQEAGPREEVWWESSGNQHRSTRHVDSAAPADEYDMNLNSSPGQTTNNMQRLDKLLQRTVTGVFNSIKTAVGAEDGPAPAQDHDWTYVTTSIELSVGGCVARLVGARRAAAHVDAALDSLHHLPPPPTHHAPPDDLEEWCGGEGGRWAGAAELLAAAGLLRSHLAHRLATVLAGDVIETLICSWLEQLTAWVRAQVFQQFELLARAGTEPAPKHMRKFDLQETCQAVLDSLPEVYLFSEETLTTAVSLVLSSLSHKEINRDVAYRIIDVLVVHFKHSASLRNPSFDNN